MRKIFHDDMLDRSFRDNGYVVVDLLDKDQIVLLQGIFDRERSSAHPNFYLTLWYDLPEQRSMVHGQIQQAISHANDLVLNKYKPIVSSFAVKHPGPDSSWHAHQDDTFVDEGHFISLSVWAPLCDTDQINGTMRVWPGSHLRYPGPRSPNLPRLFAPDMDKVNASLVDINLQAGQAIIFDHRLIHASGPNSAQEDRVAVVTVMIPEEASLTYVYLDTHASPPMVRQYAISDRYYLEEPLGESSREPDPAKFRLLTTYPYIETSTISR